MLIALKCAVVAWVYVNILVKPGMILHPLARMLEKALVKEIYVPYYERKEHWLYKPLLGCELCVTGQMALWVNVYQMSGIIQSVVSISFSILITYLISGIIKKIYA